MAFSSKDGTKKFGSRFQKNRYDSVHAEKMDSGKVGEGEKSTGNPVKGSEPKAMSRVGATGETKGAMDEAHVPDNDVKGMNMEEGSQEAPANVVAQHGPATHTHVHSDHKTGKHVVVSHHADGHMHHNLHKSADAAQSEAAQLGGPANTENTDSAPNADADNDNDLFGNDSFKTPRLA